MESSPECLRKESRRKPNRVVTTDSSRQGSINMKISEKYRLTAEWKFPKSDSFKYLSAGTIEWVFPTQRNVLVRTIEVTGNDTHVKVYFPGEDRVEGDIKKEDMFPLLAPSDFLIIDSKTHHIVRKLVYQDTDTAVAEVLVEYADVPQANPAQADKAFISSLPVQDVRDAPKANIPNDEAFKYLTQGSVYIMNSSQDLVINRMFRISEDRSNAEVTVLFERGSTLRGTLPYGDVAKYIARGDFYADAPQYRTYIVEGKRLTGNTFNMELQFSATPTPPY
jgi:hypothetical protein